jgi:hypothetical protein
MPKQQLVPKPPKSNNHPHHAHRISAAERLWSLTASAGKAGAIGWQTAANDVNAILNDPMWRNFRRYPNTSIRVEPPICVWDGDATDLALMDLVLDDLHSLDPEAYDKALFRSSGKVSLAIIFRCRVPFRHVKTRAYTAHPEYLADLEAARALPQGTAEEATAKRDAIVHVLALLDPQKFEMFGGLSPRHFVVEGRHPDDRDYVFETERTIWNTHRDDVPFIPAAYDAEGRHGELMDRAEAIMQAAGLTVIPEPVRPHGDVVYDLTPETLFIPKGAPAGTLAELTAGMSGDAKNGVRGCLLSTIVSKSGSNCTLYVTNSGRVAVADWANDGLMHYMESDKEPPRPEMDEATRAKLADLRAAAGGGQPPPSSPTDEPEPGKDATPEDVLQFLLRNYAVDRHAGKIVDLRATDIDKAYLDLPVFHLCYAGFRFFTPPKTDKGKGTWTPATQRWLIHPDRLNVAATRFRPGLPFPLYADETGALHKNTYRQPGHVGDADLGPLLDDFLPVFIPDPVQREYLLDVMAHRWQHPDIPGPSLIFVAHGAVDPMAPDFGTGRSAWFDFEARLFTRAYVRNEDFRTISGQSSQGDFTSWKAYKRLVTVDEAQTTPESNSFKGGLAGYETLKTLADPAPRWRTFKVKYGKAFEDFDYAPMDVASNHQGATHMAGGDRRFGGLDCGRPMTMAEAKAFHLWQKLPGAPAAFARWCEARDLSNFNPYAPPPVFAAKERMQALSVGDMDLAFKAMQKAFGKLFTKSQARSFVIGDLETTPVSGDVQFDRRFEAAFREYCTALRSKGEDVRVTRPPIKTEDGGVLGRSKRERVYTFESRMAHTYAGWPQTSIKAMIETNVEALRNQHTQVPDDPADTPKTDETTKSGPNTRANGPGGGPVTTH